MVAAAAVMAAAAEAAAAMALREVVPPTAAGGAPARRLGRAELQAKFDEAFKRDPARLEKVLGEALQG